MGAGKTAESVTLREECFALRIALTAAIMLRFDGKRMLQQRWEADAEDTSGSCLSGDTSKFA
eukprot:CAMPEP_0203943936 /NCGR_PEP_ID=MMETSP0359-20131031/79807_1 /ASSEMBLY_ACC=CAM_ASM_000338 /TAXON_ID=268821 /ORGANISM="Scrippsiella Hangoei, Strain SHTV-5" /LENGTH=61 /DNA_ID=CAMNT_0050874889 /DNA_START=1 /DNA_END=182 /DNA_ORIENTATION=-